MTAWEPRILSVDMQKTIFYAFFISLSTTCKHIYRQGLPIFFCRVLLSDFKKHGFNPILGDFMRDLNTLESNGILVNRDEKGEIKLFVVQFLSFQPNVLR